MVDILKENESRWVLFPITHTDVWEFRKKQLANIWTVEEIDLQQDIHDWQHKLSDDDKYFIENVLAFFAASDGIVNENLVFNMTQQVQIPEARSFYAQQIANEDIHSETYSILIDTLVDESKKDKLYNAIKTIPSIMKKAEWAVKWMDNPDATFAEKLIAFSVVEGVFFSGSFCAIFWLKNRGVMPGLSFANELISRDESLHCDFACLLHDMMLPHQKVPKQKIIDIVTEAIEIECEFVTESLPVSLIGMNSDAMCQYIRHIADRLLMILIGEKYYNDENPFGFTDQIGMVGKTNFFEKRVSDYAKAGVMSDAMDANLDFGADF